MAHDIFLCYSSRDKPTVDAVCTVLEAANLRCWVAPRDVLPGADWGESIVDAIACSKAMVLVFSANANDSRQVRREVDRADHSGIPIIPLRIEYVEPTKSLAYYISASQWLDAYTPPLERHLHYLAGVLQRRLNISNESRPGASTPPDLPEAARLEEQRTAAETARHLDEKRKADEVAQRAAEKRKTESAARRAKAKQQAEEDAARQAEEEAARQVEEGEVCSEPIASSEEAFRPVAVIAVIAVIAVLLIGGLILVYKFFDIEYLAILIACGGVLTWRMGIQGDDLEEAVPATIAILLCIGGPILVYKYFGIEYAAILFVCGGMLVWRIGNEGDDIEEAIPPTIAILLCVGGPILVYKYFGLKYSAISGGLLGIFVLSVVILRNGFVRFVLALIITTSLLAYFFLDQGLIHSIMQHLTESISRVMPMQIRNTH